MEQEEKQPVLGLKEAKDIIDAFCLSMLKCDADALSTLEKQQIIDLLLNGNQPNSFSPYRSVICQKYFGMDCIPAIKQMRMNPADLLVAMALHKR